jgi:MSHA pilin protein MshD
MNTGQMMLVIGAMLLLSTITLRVNTNNLMNATMRDEAQFGILATSLATSLIEEASSKAFDNITDTTSVSSTNALTEVSDLGPDGIETYDTFNDFDDYKGYTRDDTTMQSAPFHIDCDVYYVSSSNVEITSSVKTWHKKITVKVTSDFMNDTIETSSIFSYWTFR